MSKAQPTGYFITWTVYGTHLPGDGPNWRHRKQGQKLPAPLLRDWTADRLKHDVELLEAHMRLVTQAAIEHRCKVKNWKLWSAYVGCNHVHVVVSASSKRPETVRDQLKSASTEMLRIRFPSWRGRPVWTRCGDVEFLCDEDAIAAAVQYVEWAQTHKDREIDAAL
ncbi:MAG: transposase [Planctomycetota bacterium]